MAIEVKLFDDLAAVARDAGGALDRAATPSLFDRLDWYRLTACHCPPAGRLLIARARLGEERLWLFLTLAGRHARALASWYTLDFAPAAQGGNPALLAAIARTLRQLGIATLELAPLSQPERLRAAFAAAGWLVSARPATSNWRVDTAGQDFAEYWARRPKRLRETARRRNARAGLDVTIHSGFDADAWAAYEHVYARSWKPAEGSPAFLREVAVMEGNAGTLRLGIARKNGEPIAAQIWLVENGVATIHKLAHVEAARELSPGTILTMRMFEHVLEQDRPDVVDFGTGDDPYKADWMEERRPLWRLEAWNPRTLTGIAGAARAAAASLVRRVRSD